MFLSIPIAEPPVGKLRFKAPVPRSPWSGILNATDYSFSCYWNSTRTSFYPSEFPMSEDCINVNIFTNKKCLEIGGCAVTGYIHGGYLQFGTPLQFYKNILIENFNNVTRDIVFVTISFRQAMFGVLNLNWKLNISMDMNSGLHGRF